jgi:hypothetical protein
MPGALSGVKLLPMTRSTLSLLLALSVGGCAYDRVDPPANESMTGPALSHPREPRKSADPPPPIREDLHQTNTQLITQAEAAPVRSSSTLLEAEPSRPVHPTVIEPGVVSPLR